jgi:hypothetical protein
MRNLEGAVGEFDCPIFRHMLLGGIARVYSDCFSLDRSFARFLVQGAVTQAGQSCLIVARIADEFYD